MKPPIKSYPHSLWTNPVHFVACGFGSGALPKTPGTWGTLAAIPFYLVLHHLPIGAYSLVTLLLIMAGVWICGKTARDFGIEDHPAIVWDEFSSFFIILIGIPFSWFYLLLAVLLFRFFDICKPGPIRWIDQHIHGGLGIMLDDVAAAIAAGIILHLIVWVMSYF